MCFISCDNGQRKLNPLASAWDDNYSADDSDGRDGVRMEEEGQTPEPSAASAKRDKGPTAASEAAGHDNDGSDGVRMEEEG
jgi:hypothetical protein